MPISQVTYKKKNGKARYDPNKRAYIGYRIDVVIKGKRHRDGGFASRRDAENFIDRLKGEARDRRNGLAVNGHRRVSELFTRRLNKITHPRVRQIASRTFQQFQEVLGDDLHITEVRASHFQLYVNSRDVSSSSIRRELAELSTAFRSVPEIFPELEDFTPPIIKRPRRAKLPTRHIITPEEKDAIVANLQATDYQRKIARMFTVAWFLGLRYGELIRLEKTDLKNRTLRVVRWKTGDITVFEELPPEVVKALKDASKDSPSDLIFPATQIYPNSFYVEFGKAVTAAGLVYGRGKLDAITFHSTRHSFVTRAMEHGDLATVGSLSAHADASMVMHYTHATPAKRKALMRKMYGDDKTLRAIYDKIRSGKMGFDEFRQALK